MLSGHVVVRIVLPQWLCAGTLWTIMIMEEMAVARDSFSVRPLSAHTGAEIAGVDLSGPVDEQTAKS